MTLEGAWSADLVLDFFTPISKAFERLENLTEDEEARAAALECAERAERFVHDFRRSWNPADKLRQMLEPYCEGGLLIHGRYTVTMHNWCALFQVDEIERRIIGLEIFDMGPLVGSRRQSEVQKA